MSHSGLALYINCAVHEYPKLTSSDITEISDADQQLLRNLKFLKVDGYSKYASCCDDSYEVWTQSDGAGSTSSFIRCTECGRVEIDRAQLRQWRFCYEELLRVLQRELKCRGEYQTIIPRTLWNIGRAALAGQSRPIWVARTFTNGVKQNLPDGKQPILFVIAPMCGEEKGFVPDRTFEISEFMWVEKNKLVLDVASINNQLNAIVATNDLKQKSPKGSKKANAIKTAKDELHRHILSMKSLIANSTEKLPYLTQKDLAMRINENQPMMTRILEEDPHLRILFETANNENMIRDYKKQ